MTRKQQIADDLWRMIRRVYEIGSDIPTSDKQIKLIEVMSTYVDENYGPKRKKESKEKS
jgi:hypothetical protein